MRKLRVRSEIICYLRQPQQEYRVGLSHSSEGGRDLSKEGVASRGSVFAVWLHTNFQIQWGEKYSESQALMHTSRNILKCKSCSSMPSGCLKSNFPFSIFNMHSCNSYRELYLKCKSGQAIEIRPFS